MTPKNKITCSAPGSLMLLGEHAVLHGRRALVCAINQRITVNVFQCLEKVLRIDSELGKYESQLDHLEDHPDFRFVLDAVKQYPLEQGIELKIESDFPGDIGFGSSAAVTVATHAALMVHSGRANSPSEPLHRNDGSPGRFAPPVGPENKGRATPPAEPFLMELFKRALATIHRVQGRGSGADVAASVFGGVVAYRVGLFEQIQNRGDRVLSAGWKPAVRIAGVQLARNEKTPSGNVIEIHPIAESFPLTAVYSGSKMKTADVIRSVEKRRTLNPESYEKIFDRMDASVGEVIESISNEVERLRGRYSPGRARSERARSSRPTPGLKCLGKKLIENQFLMEEMGLCNDALAEIISIFQTLEIPAKISGSGLGDCAISLGSVAPAGLPASGKRDNPFGDYPVYALQVDPQGVAAK